jgi:hypothetical protein
MKHFRLVLSFFLLFSVVNGFCEDNTYDLDFALLEIRNIIRSELQDFNRQKQGYTHGKLTPITGTLANKIIAAGLRLNTLDFYLPGSTTLMSKPDSKFNVRNGTLVYDEGYKTEIIQIPFKERGKLVKRETGQDGKEILTISFLNNGIKLEFYLNKKNDRFEFKKDSDYRFDGPVPVLCIYYEQIMHDKILSRSNEVQRIPIRRGNVLLEDGRLKRENIVAFIFSRNPAMPRHRIESIVSTYIWEAQSEQINHDIAIAQMCYATNFLKIEKSLNTHNYAGFLNSRFVDMPTGVRAHIQHLKGYVSFEEPKRKNVDPRYDILKREGILGTVTTLEGLYATWAPQSYDYGERIDRILYDLNQFSF